MLINMPEQPFIRIVQGTPTAEEVAALVGVLLPRSGSDDEPAPVQSLWTRSARPGTRPSSWRAAALPR
jgi:hypothetical protein